MPKKKKDKNGNKINIVEKWKKEIINNLNENITYFEDSDNNKKKNSFLDKFFVCEFIMKSMMYHYFHDKDEFQEKKDIILNINQIIPTVKLFNYSIDENLIYNIFGAKVKRGSKSCKKLRDAIVHNFSSNDCYEVCERYDELISYMDSFIDIIVNNRR